MAAFAACAALVACVQSAIEADSVLDGIATTATLPGGRGLEVLADVLAGGDRALQLGEFGILVSFGGNRGNITIGVSRARCRALRRCVNSRAGIRRGMGGCLNSAAGRSRRFRGLGSICCLRCGGCRSLVGFPLRDLRLYGFALLDFVVHRRSPVVVSETLSVGLPRYRPKDPARGHRGLDAVVLAI